MEENLPYFVIALGMVIFGHFYVYPNLITELLINTVFICAFIGFAQYRDRFLTIFFGKEKDENQAN